MIPNGVGVQHAPSSTATASTSTAWGANFWVTIQDPQTEAIFYACPATGDCSWDPPENNFVLPPSTEGEWWELKDESREGLSYFYHTKSGQTQWHRPEGFVIPLGMVQNSALGRRLSHVYGQQAHEAPSPKEVVEPEPQPQTLVVPQVPSKENGQVKASPSPHRPNRRSLTPIPSDSSSNRSRPPSPSLAPRPSTGTTTRKPALSVRSRSSSQALPRATEPPLNLDAAASLVVASLPSSPILRANGAPPLPPSPRHSSSSGKFRRPQTASTLSSPSGLNAPPSPLFPPAKLSSPLSAGSPKKTPPSPSRPVPDVPGGGRSRSATLSSLRSISAPILNKDKPSFSPLSPFSQRAIPTAPVPVPIPIQTSRLSTGEHPTLPPTLAEDIKRFATSEYARKFFSQHRKGFWFLKRRKIPVHEMMKWQKMPLTAPLLVMNSSLHRHAVNAFKVIQRIMGDRDPSKPVGVKSNVNGLFRAHNSPTNSVTTSYQFSDGEGGSLLEEERWLLEAGVTHLELRDEIYCQVMKQLGENPSTESTFRGWQLLCVLILTFPPSKYFQDHLSSFLTSRLDQKEDKIDVMARYCLRRMEIIMWKGPRGKAPSCEEIEAASDAAFHPSVFGESLESILSLQSATYPPHLQPVPIILPFLSSGILALGGLKEEGIFRLPGDPDAVASLRLRIERGHYHLEGVDDPHVCANLLKSWLRELREPVIPEGEMYNSALEAAALQDTGAVLSIVRRLPEVNRRVLLHVVSFLQMFVKEDVVCCTKMTQEGLARVMTPNLIRASTGDLDVAFKNNHFENLFVLLLIRHLECGVIDPGYKPVHGRTG